MLYWNVKVVAYLIHKGIIVNSRSHFKRCYRYADHLPFEVCVLEGHISTAKILQVLGRYFGRMFYDLFHEIMNLYMDKL